METNPPCPMCHLNRVIAVDSVESNIIHTNVWKEKGITLDLRGYSGIIKTLYYCPHCNYIWPCESDTHNMTNFLEVADSNQFITWINHPTLPQSVKIFMGYYEICYAEKSYKYAGVAALHAAWACDDHRLYTFGRICRALAASSFYCYFKEGPKEFATVYAHQMIDCYRRSNNYIPAINCIIWLARDEIDEFELKRRIAMQLSDEKEVNPEFQLNKTLMFEYCLCMMRDRRIHYLTEIPKDISKQFSELFLRKL